MSNWKKWKRGPAEEFWMEDFPPSGTHDNYVFDANEELEFNFGKMDLLHLLDALDVIDYGVIYESVDCVRIKVRDR